MIGEYIHFRYKNYLKYGIGKKGSSQKGSVKEAYKTAKLALRQQANHKNNQINKGDLSKINKILNEFLEYNRLGVRKPNSNVDEQIIQSEVNKEIQQFPKYFNNTTINWETGSVTNTKITNSSISSKQKRSKASYNKRAQYATINRLYKSILNRMQTMKIADRKVLADWNKIQKDISELELLLSEEIELNSPEAKKFVKYSNNTKAQDLVRRMNNLETLLSTSLVNTGAQGQLAEILAKVASDKAFGIANKKIKTEIVGSLRQSHSAINVGNLVGGSGVLGDLKSYKLHSGQIGNGIYKTTNPTESKSDVLITYPDNTHLSLSVKNYNLEALKYSNKGIGLLKGSSVLQLLQNEEIFLNHYLNIVPDRTGNNTFKDYSKNVDRVGVHSYAKALIFSYALMGNTFRISDSPNFIPWANAFMVLDNSKGIVKSYSMTDIIQTLMNNINIANNLRTGDFDKINAVTNMWQGSEELAFNPALANQRIVKMLSQLHQMKLDVEMPLTLLNKVKPIA